MIDRDVLETSPDVPVREGDDLGLPRFVYLGDRLEQRLGRHGHSLMTNALPPGTKFVTETLTPPVPVIVIPPGQGIGLIADPIADDRLGLQEGVPDLLVDLVAGEEPPKVRRLERHELILHVLEHPLGVKDVEEEPGIVRVPVEVERQDLGWVEAYWVVECTRGRLGSSPTALRQRDGMMDILSLMKTADPWRSLYMRSITQQATKPLSGLRCVLSLCLGCRERIVVADDLFWTVPASDSQHPLAWVIVRAASRVGAAEGVVLAVRANPIHLVLRVNHGVPSLEFDRYSANLRSL